MNTPLVSIIIPVYKAEATLHKCLDSIVNQTMKEWEAVLVDDGSPDSSGQICDEYAAKDSRFRVVHQQNSGVAMARQTGVDIVLGEFVIHADADDWVESTMLEELYSKAKESCADVVICDYYNDTLVGEFYQKQEPTSLEPRIILEEIFHRLHGSLCNKLVKRACYTEYNLHFYKGINYCEDVLVWAQLLRYENIKIAYLPRAFYHYVQSPQSITNHYTKDTLDIQKKYVAVLSELLPKDSNPVRKAKEWTKELAYRNSVLSNKEFDCLYPEIKTSHHNNAVMRLMYWLAFNGHYCFADLLKKIYWKNHEKK